MDHSPAVVPEPDATLEPAGFTVDDDGVRIHFLDWGGPPAPSAAGVVAVHGHRSHGMGVDTGRASPGWSERVAANGRHGPARPRAV